MKFGKKIKNYRLGYSQGGSCIFSVYSSISGFFRTVFFICVVQLPVPGIIPVLVIPGHIVENAVAAEAVHFFLCVPVDIAEHLLQRGVTLNGVSPVAVGE